MKKVLMLIAGLAAFLWIDETRAQTQSQSQTTAQQQTSVQARLGQHEVRDANGDGICDHCGNLVGSGKTNAQGKVAKKGKHWGPGDGTGNQGVGPRDGTGYGSQSGPRNGAQDGSGMNRGPQRETSPAMGSAGCQARRGGRR
jgi:hypothetical protein